MKLETRDPASLRPLHILKTIPAAELADDAPRFHSLCDDTLERRGLAEPLKITAEGHLVDLDSWDRWKAARAAQLATVPCLIIDADRVFGTFVSALAQRRHYTRSALAYVLYPALKEAHQESKARRAKNLKTGQNSRSATQWRIGKTADDLADEIGIGRALFQYAARVHDLFEKDAKYKGLMEPRILAEPIGGEHETARPVGLGAVIAGYPGWKKTKGEERIDHEADVLFFRGLKLLVLRTLRVDDEKLLRARVREVLETIEDGAHLHRLMGFADELHDQAKARTRALTKGAGF